MAELVASSSNRKQDSKQHLHRLQAPFPCFRPSLPGSFRSSIRFPNRGFCRFDPREAHFPRYGCASPLNRGRDFTQGVELNKEIPLRPEPQGVRLGIVAERHCDRLALGIRLPTCGPGLRIATDDMIRLAGILIPDTTEDRPRPVLDISWRIRCGTRG